MLCARRWDDFLNISIRWNLSEASLLHIHGVRVAYRLVVAIQRSRHYRLSSHFNKESYVRNIPYHRYLITVPCCVHVIAAVEWFFASQRSKVRLAFPHRRSSSLLYIIYIQGNFCLRLFHITNTVGYTHAYTCCVRGVYIWNTSLYFNDFFFFILYTGNKYSSLSCCVRGV